MCWRRAKPAGSFQEHVWFRLVPGSVLGRDYRVDPYFISMNTVVAGFSQVMTTSTSVCPSVHVRCCRGYQNRRATTLSVAENHRIWDGWIKPATPVTNIALKIPKMTGAQLQQLLKHLPDGVTFHDIMDKDQSAHMKTLFKSGRSADSSETDGAWVPPIDLRLTSSSGTHQYVLGRRKWKSAGG